MAVSGDLDFYTTSAQVIPVLFIVLAFEMRGMSSSFVPDDVTRAVVGDLPNRGVVIFRALYTIVVTLVLTIGEAAAFIGIVYGFEPKFYAGHVGWFVFLALIFGGTGVITPLLSVQINLILSLFIDSGGQADNSIPNDIRLCILFCGVFLVLYFIASMMWALIH